MSDDALAREIAALRHELRERHLPPARLQRLIARGAAVGVALGAILTAVLAALAYLALRTL